MIIYNVFIDYNDTIFPTHDFIDFYDELTDQFNVPCSLQIFVDELDELLYALFVNHFHIAKFHIVTYASKDWIRKTSCILPKFKSLIETKYIRIVYCEKNPKFHYVYPIIQNNIENKLNIEYLAIGDDKHDVHIVDKSYNAYNNQHKDKQIVYNNIHSLEFISKPHIESVVFQWRYVHLNFEKIMKNRSHPRSNFTDSE